MAVLQSHVMVYRSHSFLSRVKKNMKSRAMLSESRVGFSHDDWHKDFVILLTLQKEVWAALEGPTRQRQRTRLNAMRLQIRKDLAVRFKSLQSGDEMETVREYFKFFYEWNYSYQVRYRWKEISLCTNFESLPAR
jgi:hypothetical protein